MVTLSKRLLSSIAFLIVASTTDGLAVFSSTRPLNLVTTGLISAIDFSAAAIVGNGFSLCLGDEQKARLKDHRQRPVTVGVRPFAIRSGAHPESTIDLSVKLTEYLGSNTVLISKVGNSEVLVEMESGKNPRIGERLQMNVAPGNVYIFDIETELRL